MPGILGNAQPINYGYTMREGQQMLSGQVDFSKGISQNLIVDLQQVGMPCVRTIYVDNANNVTDMVSIVNVGMNQKIFVPSKMQGFYPFFQIGPTLSMSFTNDTVASGLFNFALLNYDVPPMQLTRGGLSVGVSGYAASFVDYSGSITLGGTQQLLQTNTSGRRRVFVQNPSTAALQGIAGVESLFIGFGGGAAAVIGPPAIEIMPGQAFDSGVGMMDVGPLRAIASTTGHKFTAFVW